MGNANQDSNAASALIKSRAFDAAFTANSIANPDGIITEANATFLRIWGYATREEVVGKPIAHFFKDPNDLTGIMAELDGMGYWEGDFVAKRNGSSPFMAHGSATVVCDETGRLLGYQSAVMDITEVRRAEDALRKSEIQYRALFEGAAEGILVAKVETREFQYANPAMCRMLGYTEHELLRLGVADIHPQECLEQVLADFEKLIDGGGRIVETPCLRKDGSVINVSITATYLVLDGCGLLFGFFTDVTAHKQAEHALRTSEEKYRGLIELAVDGILLGAPDGVITGANVQMQKLTGRPVEQLLGRHIREFFTPEELDAKPLRFDLLDSGGVLINERDLSLPDGSSVSVEMHSKRMPDGTYQSIIRDVTARKQAMSALAASEVKYRQLHESMMDAFVSMNMTGRIVDSNPAYQEMLGYTQEELRELTYNDITPETWHAYEDRVLAEQVLSRGYSSLYEKEYRRKDGSVLPVELRTFLIRDADGNQVSMWAIVRNITERKRSEDALLMLILSCVQVETFDPGPIGD